MRRRSRAGGEPTKLRRRKTVTLKRRIATKPIRGRSSSAASQETETKQLARERDEALEQFSAASEVLKVISSSPGDLKPVFEAILESATRICDAKFGNLWLREVDNFRNTATFGAPPAYREYFDREPVLHPDPRSGLGTIVRTKKEIHIADIRSAPTFKDKMRSATIELAKARSLVGVPLLRDGEVVGVIAIYRQQVRPFTDKQVALLTNFAAQAVIAIENTRLLNELRQRTGDLTEALEQQTATSEVLKVISSSPGELEPVFQAVLEKATRICEANFGTLYRFDGVAFYHAAGHGTPDTLIQVQKQQGRFVPEPGTLMHRVMHTRAVAHSADYSAESARGLSAKFGGARSTVVVPMLKDNELVGAFAIYRQEVRPFTDKQIELVQNFAAQAVIAIENARLLNELRESLEQQTATADVLRVISSSPGELEPVFQAMLENATRICHAKFGILMLRDGDGFRSVSVHGAPAAYAEAMAQNPHIPPRPGSGLVTLAQIKQPVQLADLQTEPAYQGNRLATLAGARTLLMVPMMKDDELVGALNFYRQEVRLFTDKQIALVENFAAQAVIAIENTRLLGELRQRTGDLTESLEQQTATSKVLEVISRSAFDLQAVFETVAESSVRLCGADRAFIFRFDGELLRMVAAYNSPPEFQEWVAQNPIRPGRHSGSARAALERRTIHIPDVRMDPEYTYGAKDAEAIRTVLGVPILKGDDLLGVMMIYHLEVRPFTKEQIHLVETFADQAAIAIENVRLLDALRHRTDELDRSVGELRALGEVSQAVNSTLDLEKVLSTIVANAVQLSNTGAGAIYGYDEWTQEFRLRATYGMDQDLIDALAQHHIGFDEPNVALAFAQREPVQIADLKEEARSELTDVILGAGYRARLMAPLLRGEDIVGMLVVRRKMPGQFTQNTVGLIKTFAAQSALAIQNARLFDSVETRTRELAKSLEDLRTAQDRLVQTQKLASLGQLTAGIAHEIKNPLNFVNNFSGVSVELIDELQQTVKSGNFDDKARADIADLTETLRGNLDKIVQHGKRADSIVKNMLLHSREGSGEHRAVNINALVDESLNLAYHGARAEKQGFEITLARSFDPTAGEVDLFPQDISRVLLNVISNGFYAASKRKREASDENHVPTLSASTINLGDRVEIRIRDNGIGIPPEVKEKMFNPFFTTKPAGEGTGLGLSISYDIVVKQHSGSIEVDTKPGDFTEIRIVLPRTAAFHV